MNTPRPFWKTLAQPRHLAALALVGVALAATPALAEDPVSCTSDADCGDGLACVVVAESCSASSEPGSEPVCTTDRACMAPEMPDFNECQADSDCPGSFKCQSVGEVCMGSTGGGTVEPDGTGEPMMSTPTEGACQAYFMCVPPPPPTCTTTADCSGGLVCNTFTFEECSGGEVDPQPVGNGTSTDGSGRDPVSGQGSCTTSTESYCVPPYIGACQADADCGPGFTCEAEVVCPPCARPEPAPGDGTNSDGDISCSAECAASGDRYCKLQEITCAADADCPSNFTCETFDQPTIAPACDPDGGACDETTPPPQPQPERLCMPPAWDTWISPGGTTSNGSPDSTSAPSYDERLTGSTGKSGGWKLVETTQAPANGATDAKDEGGCSTAPTPSAPAPAAGLGLLGLLGMMLVRRRR